MALASHSQKSSSLRAVFVQGQTQAAGSLFSLCKVFGVGPCIGPGVPSYYPGASPPPYYVLCSLRHRWRAVRHRVAKHCLRGHLEYGGDIAGRQHLANRA